MRLPLRGSWPLLAALGLAACIPGTEDLDPAPEDLDGLFRFFWDQYPEGADSQLVDAVRKLDPVIEGSTRAFDKPRKGLLTDLPQESLGKVQLEHSPIPQAADASGLFLVKTFPCTLDKLEKIVTALDQKAQFPDSYKAYARTYTTDSAAYFARSAPQLSWDVQTESENSITGTFKEHIKGGIRRVEAQSDGKSPTGPFLVQRTWLVKPAETSDADNNFKQDYQIEIYWERKPGEVVHAYGLWRQFDFSLVDNNDKSALDLMLNSLSDFDDDVAELCKK